MKEGSVSQLQKGLVDLRKDQSKERLVDRSQERLVNQSQEGSVNKNKVQMIDQLKEG